MIKLFATIILISIFNIANAQLCGKQNCRERNMDAAVQPNDYVIFQQMMDSIAAHSGGGGSDTADIAGYGILIGRTANRTFKVDSSKIETKYAASQLTISGVKVGSNLFTHTNGYGLTGSTYNGTAAQTWKVDTSGTATNPATQNYVIRHLPSTLNLQAVTNVGNTTSQPITCIDGGVLAATNIDGSSVQLNTLGSRGYINITNGGGGNTIIMQHATYGSSANDTIYLPMQTGNIGNTICTMVNGVPVDSTGNVNVSTDWLLIGNSGLSPGSNLLGTTDGSGIIFIQNDSNRIQIGTDGVVSINQQGFPYAYGPLVLNGLQSGGSSDSVLCIGMRSGAVPYVFYKSISGGSPVVDTVICLTNSSFTAPPIDTIFTVNKNLIINSESSTFVNIRIQIQNPFEGEFAEILNQSAGYKTQILSATGDSVLNVIGFGSGTIRYECSNWEVINIYPEQSTISAPPFQSVFGTGSGVTSSPYYIYDSSSSANVFNVGFGALSANFININVNSSLASGTAEFGDRDNAYSFGYNNSIKFDFPSGHCIIGSLSGGGDIIAGADNFGILHQYTLGTNLSLVGNVVNVTTNSLTGTSGTPTIAAGTGAGTSPTVSISGTNIGGLVNVTTGTLGVTTGIVATITYNGLTFPTDSYPILYPNNAATALLSGTTMVYVTGTTTTFVITSGASALTPTTAYSWNFAVTGN